MPGGHHPAYAWSRARRRQGVGVSPAVPVQSERPRRPRHSDARCDPEGPGQARRPGVRADPDLDRVAESVQIDPKLARREDRDLGLGAREIDPHVEVFQRFGAAVERLPDGLVNEPTLSWDLAAARAGRQSFDLGYATAGLAWRADYQVDVAGGSRACRMDIEGAAMVANRAGADFNDVALTLVAGEPNRVQASVEPVAADANGAVRVQVRVRDEKFQPVDDATVTVDVEPIVFEGTAGAAAAPINNHASAAPFWSLGSRHCASNCNFRSAGVRIMSAASVGARPPSVTQPLP